MSRCLGEIWLMSQTQADQVGVSGNVARRLRGAGGPAAPAFVREALAAGNKIEAIRLYLQHCGADSAEG